MLAYGCDGEISVRPVILQVGDKLALGIESKREGLRLYGRRKIAKRPHHHFARERISRELVRDRRSRRVKRDPKAIAAVESDVVGKTRQVIREDVRGSGFFPLEPVAQDAVAAGLVHEYESLVGPESYPVRKLQVSKQHSCFARGEVEDQEMAMPAMLDDVFGGVREVEFRGGVP